MMPPAELAKQDIALLNLRCADGLTDVDIDKCLATLDRWAEAVKRDTDRHLYKFQQNPAEYENSEGYFRMMMLITVLQQDFNVHYNPDRIRSVDFKNPDDLFIHGMLASNNGGTCVSMPVLLHGCCSPPRLPCLSRHGKGARVLPLGRQRGPIQHRSNQPRNEQFR